MYSLIERLAAMRQAEMLDKAAQARLARQARRATMTHTGWRTRVLDALPWRHPRPDYEARPLIEHGPPQGP
jgi:hypothetical protein